MRREKSFVTLMILEIYASSLARVKPSVSRLACIQDPNLTPSITLALDLDITI
ncbi:BnaA02g35310D [Brassica napus]|uniref:BnaA02g35310D protein n=1 Tax=Brassica napus TaxID=3708 RepID=A0A078J6D2_BRANA|nr:BnaA02g35310D [Brassica napus]